MPATDYALAFSAGVISFASPCVMPLVPVYLSVTTGLAVSELSGNGRDRVSTVARGAGLFILGFSAVFIGLGLSATEVGAVLLGHRVPITRLAGVLVIAMALFMLAGSRIGGLAFSREWRFHPRRVPQHAIAVPIVTGAAFAFGWTPCIGPVLGSILAIAAGHGGVLHGGALLATYSAGLGVPLLATGLAFHRALVPMGWARRHSAALSASMAVVLLGYGLLLAFDRLSWLTLTLQAHLTA